MDNLIKTDIIAAHKRYAEEIVRLYHGEEFIKVAEERYAQVAKGGIPEDIKTITLSSEATEMGILDILTKEINQRKENEKEICLYQTEICKYGNLDKSKIIAIFVNAITNVIKTTKNVEINNDLEDLLSKNGILLVLIK